MAVAKVILNGNTLIDVTDKTVTSSNLVSPNTALGADGTTVTGALVAKSASDVTVSGATITIPAGVYSSQVQKTVSSGSATTPATTITANPSISINDSTGVITASNSTTQSVTPTVSAGYVSSGTAGTITVSGSATQQLSVYAGAHHYLAPPTYTVTISLTNPWSPGYFSSCSIYEYTDNMKGDQIGSIDSPTGSTELSLPTDIGVIRIEFRGGYISIDSDPVCTGDIDYTDMLSSGSDAYIVFSIGSSGTIEIPGIDWND